MYMVMALEKDVQVKIRGIEKTLPLTRSDGLIGFIPVFKYKKDAKKYAGKKFTIQEILEPPE